MWEGTNSPFGTDLLPALSSWCRCGIFFLALAILCCLEVVAWLIFLEIAQTIRKALETLRRRSFIAERDEAIDLVDGTLGIFGTALC